MKVSTTRMIIMHTIVHANTVSVLILTLASAIEYPIPELAPSNSAMIVIRTADPIAKESADITGTYSDWKFAFYSTCVKSH